MDVSRPQQLLLVKHSAPAIRADLPAARWQLSPEGRGRCAALAEFLASYQLRRVACSEEPKARETAGLVGAQLGVPVAPRPDLHEHARATVPLFREPGAFAARVEAMLARPDELVLGEETANQAAARFERAVTAVLAAWDCGGPACIVAHGTVISLLAHRWCDSDVRHMWRALGLPSVVEMSLRWGPSGPAGTAAAIVFGAEAAG